MTRNGDFPGDRLDAERVSCLVDGELDRGEADRLIGALCRSDELQREWRVMQLVGDALRSSEVAACHQPDFCRRVADALQSEPTVLSPRTPAARPAWRRYVVPGVAVAASVAALGFIAVPLLEPVPSTPVAQAPAAAPVVVEAAAPTAPPSRRVSGLANAAGMDVYLTAHRELTGGTAMPRAAHYLRVRNDEAR